MKELTPKEQPRWNAVINGVLRQYIAICKEHHLTYFCCGGTAIGAVRHQGMIPWDDDVDVFMPRPDYDRFISQFNKPDNYYQVIDMSIDKKYGFPFAKVHDTRTFVDELQYAKDHFGVYIDIFPIDGVGEDEQVFRILRWRKLLHTKKANYYQRTLSKKIINTFGKIVLLPFSVHRILSFIDHEARKYPYGSTPKAGNIVNPYGPREIVNLSCFSDTIYKEFEGMQFRAPIGYDEYLRSIYGDYMQLPPEDKRHSPHVSIAYWK